MLVEYKRKYSIKNLFNAKEVIDKFDFVTFESVKGFVKALELDLFSVSKAKLININVDNIEDYQIIKRIIVESNLCELTRLWIEINDQEVCDEIMVDLIPKKYDIIVSSETEINIPKIWKVENSREWTKNNRLIKRFTLRADNFKETICDIIDTYNNKFTRFFLLGIDYRGFEELKIKDLKHIRHWCYRLLSYTTKDGNKNNLSLVLVREIGFIKSIFVSNDMKLYLDDKKNPIWCLDLLKNIDKNGEDISFEELNWWGTYINLSHKAMAIDFKVWNWLLIDFAQNLELRGHINEIPEIISWLTWWLNDRK